MVKILAQFLMKKIYFLIVILLFHVFSYSIGFTHQSFYLPRPTAINAAQELVGWQQLINQYCMNRFYGAFSIMPIYSHSFGAGRLSQMFFDSFPLVVSGSRVPNRGVNDVLADYWGLPSDFKSFICFDPKISNFTMDFNWYLGLDELVSGLYVRVRAPFTFSSWNLRLQESVKDAGTAFQPAGYMSPARLTRENMVEDAQAFLCGDIWGDVTESLRYGKICGNQVENTLGLLLLAVGWNFFDEPHYHLGFNLRTAIPTGNRSQGIFLFEPMVGNGKRWELGFGITSHLDVWRGDDACHTHKLGLYFDANFTHLFTSDQLRSFDLRSNGAGSRYMLLEEVLPPSTDLFLGSAVGPEAPDQYTGRLLPAINVTTLITKTSIALQTDLVVKLSYQQDGLDLDIGYNFWGRSKETLHCRGAFPSNRFAVKGDAMVYGFDSVTSAPVALNATESSATLHAGQGAGNADFQNLNVDSPVIAADSGGNLNALLAADAAALNLPQGTAHTSDPAILLQDSDIDVGSGLLPKAYTHGLFFHVGYVWRHNPEKIEEDRWDPYIGFGSEIEFAPDSVTKNSMHNQWSLWAKGGVAF